LEPAERTALAEAAARLAERISAVS
jgi:hypothetical protein